MRAYYHQGFLALPVLELSPQATKHLFAEMDEIAEELRRDPQFIPSDLQYAFRQLQSLRRPDLEDDWLWLFDLWCDHDRSQGFFDDAKREALFDVLCEERNALFLARQRFPERSAELTAKLMDIGRKLAELESQSPSAPLGEWGP